MPYLKAPNPCELNCMPHGERFYYRHKLKVTDGTRCNDESNDVCVDGQCQVSSSNVLENFETIHQKKNQNKIKKIIR